MGWLEGLTRRSRWGHSRKGRHAGAGADDPRRDREADPPWETPNACAQDPSGGVAVGAVAAAGVKLDMVVGVAGSTAVAPASRYRGLVFSLFSSPPSWAAYAAARSCHANTVSGVT